MSKVKEQKQHIEDIASARYITGTLRDIAMIELGGLQTRFAQNTMVYGELRDLFKIVWRIAEKKGLLPTRSSKAKKRLYIAYTTNKHFYGALNQNIIQKFLESTGSNDESLVIGETGKTLLAAQGKKRAKVRHLSFADDVPSEEEVYSFLKRIVGYDQVFIVYPAFVSVFQQEAQMVDVTFRPSESTTPTTEEENPEFLLEPNIEEMLTFFNTQVRYALFERILLETQLSRVAARLVKMDTADQNAQGLLKQEHRELRRSYTSIASRRMLETLVGYIQWHKNVQHTVQ